MTYEESVEQLESLIEAWQLNEADLNQTDIDAIKIILKENQNLKQKLNWIAFGDDPELALRYLRKIGYVDFDEERKVYINKHNNEPFLLDDEEEKGYYIKDEELNEYTKQLEYQNQELKKQLENNSKINVADHKYASECEDKVTVLKEQQKEFIRHMEDYINEMKTATVYDSVFTDAEVSEIVSNVLCLVLKEYKEIIGEK